VRRRWWGGAIETASQLRRPNFVVFFLFWLIDKARHLSAHFCCTSVEARTPTPPPIPCHPTSPTLADGNSQSVAKTLNDISLFCTIHQQLAFVAKPMYMPFLPPVLVERSSLVQPSPPMLSALH